MSSPQSLRSQRRKRGWSRAQLSALTRISVGRLEIAELGLELLPGEREAIASALRGDRGEPPPRQKRGFACMAKERHRAIAIEAGKASHKNGRGHEFSSEEARAAGRKGGVSASQDKAHMSRIGKLGWAARAEKMKQAAIERQRQIEKQP